MTTNGQQIALYDRPDDVPKATMSARGDVDLAADLRIACHRVSADTGVDVTPSRLLATFAALAVGKLDDVSALRLFPGLARWLRQRPREEAPATG